MYEVIFIKNYKLSLIADRFVETMSVKWIASSESTHGSTFLPYSDDIVLVYVQSNIQ